MINMCRPIIVQMNPSSPTALLITADVTIGPSSAPAPYSITSFDAAAGIFSGGTQSAV